MSKVSTLVGEVVDGIPVFYKEIAKEKFYTIRVNFRSCDIKVLLSEHTMLEEYQGKVAVTGYLATFKTKDAAHLHEYVFVGTKVEVVDLDTPLSNEINFQYKITSIGKYRVNDYGVEVLTLFASSYTPLKTTSIIRICAKGQAARFLHNRKEKNFYINGIGYLKSHYDNYEVIIKELVDTDESEESEEAIG